MKTTSMDDTINYDEPEFNNIVSYVSFGHLFQCSFDSIPLKSFSE